MIPINPETVELIEKITYKVRDFLKAMHDHDMSDEEIEKAKKDLDGIVGMIYWLGEQAPYYLMTLFKMVADQRLPESFLATLLQEYVMTLYKHGYVIIKDILPDEIKRWNQTDQISDLL